MNINNTSGNEFIEQNKTNRRHPSLRDNARDNHFSRSDRDLDKYQKQSELTSYFKNLDN